MELAIKCCVQEKFREQGNGKIRWNATKLNMVIIYLHSGYL
jgi:hypothetical protein